MTYTEWKKTYIDSKPTSIIVNGSAENLPFKKITGFHTANEDLKAVNPNYEKGDEWRRNCQKCVPTYELRRRGYDVTAKPTKPNEFLTLGGNYAKVFENPTFNRFADNDVDKIKELMLKWGNGARAEVMIVWKHNQGLSHMFVVENRLGQIFFIDPQTANENAEKYFEHAAKGFTNVVRMDNIQFTDLIKDCCEEVKK